MKPNSVLITGANRGLGLELVKQLMASPIPPTHLYAACRLPETATDLCSFAKTNSAVKLIKLDVTNMQNVSAVKSQMELELDKTGLNLLINNAGVSNAGFKLEQERHNYNTILEEFATNAVAPIMICKAFLPLLRIAAEKSNIPGMSCSKAAIVNISSILGSITQNVQGGLYAYRGSKAALNMVTKSLSVDLEAVGILAVSMHPGWVVTGIGGQNAPLNTEESVKGMIQVMSSLDESKSGHFVDYTGKELPW